eukprot:3033150-Pleurochrysis_carterae.AAC.5
MTVHRALVRVLANFVGPHLSCSIAKLMHTMLFLVVEGCGLQQALQQKYGREIEFLMDVGGTELFYPRALLNEFNAQNPATGIYSIMPLQLSVLGQATGGQNVDWIDFNMLAKEMRLTSPRGEPFYVKLDQQDIARTTIDWVAAETPSHLSSCWLHFVLSEVRMREMCEDDEELNETQDHVSILISQDVFNRLRNCVLEKLPESLQPTRCNPLLTPTNLGADEPRAESYDFAQPANEMARMVRGCSAADCRSDVFRMHVHYRLLDSAVCIYPPAGVCFSNANVFPHMRSLSNTHLCAISYQRIRGSSRAKRLHHANAA